MQDFFNKDWWKENYGWMLIASTLYLFTTKTLFNLPLLIMAVSGMVIVYKSYATLVRDHDIKTMFILFLCLTVPLLLALPDAVWFKSASGTFYRYLLYPFISVFVIITLRQVKSRRYLLMVCTGIAVFWMLDGLIQLLLGKNIIGNPMKGDDLTGMFYPKIIMGLVLSVLSPILIEYVRKNYKKSYGVLLIIPVLLLIIVKGGSRSSWVTIFIVAIIYLLMFRRCIFNFTGVRGLLLSVLLLFGSGVALLQVDSVGRVIDKSVKVFSSDFESIDFATSRRLSLWQVGWKAFEDNRINGIGARGFRYVFTDFAEDDNYWMQDGRSGSTHPHFMLLEVVLETGLIGVLGLVIFFYVLIRRYLSASKEDRACMFPWLLAAIMAYFPLNMHMALYGSYWSSLSWWLLSIAIGMGSRTRLNHQGNGG